MSALAEEIDQVLQQLDSAAAERLEKLLRNVLALVKPEGANGNLDANLRFPLVRDAQHITSEDVARVQDEV